ncbi:MAG: Ig-like domain-containing protein [Deltaproteobacteria bacterium]|nr:Ig-like domain-containing protein [Deltaproteobacteria bacterium]
MAQSETTRTIWTCLLAAMLVGGCGGGAGLQIGPPASTQTPTRTATPRPTPTPTHNSVAGVVNGLIVIGSDVAPSAGSELGAPPSNWGKEADQANFDRALGYADYRIGDKQGTTAADGSFSIPDLPPGRYLLEVSRTVNGNLLPVNVPVVVGDDGATVIAEVGQGVLRTSITYTKDGVVVRQVIGSSGNWLTTRDGKIAEIGDPTRVLSDSNGDGRFERPDCGSSVTLCTSDMKICPNGQFCQCIAACPFCDNCEMPGVCGAPSTRLPYRCNPDGGCALSGDHCVDPCPDCADSVTRVCIPSCDPLTIVAVNVQGPAQIVVGRTTQLYATAQLSDGTVMDVTQLVDWQSSATDFATIDSWGRLNAIAVGAVTVTAKLDDTTFGTLDMTVVDHPALKGIYVQNLSCICGPIYATNDVAAGTLPPCYYADAPASGILPSPSCSSVIAIGTTLQLMAIGQFADDSQEDITQSVEWSVDPTAVGTIDAGLFTAAAAGAANITASLDGVNSDPTSVTVVTEPTLVSLSIYPGNWGYLPVAGGPLADGTASPCFNCGTSVTVLRGDELQFQATGHYDTNEWRDLSKQVSWRSSDTAVAPIDGSGLMTAAQGGTATVDATLDGVTSNPVAVQVVNQATLLSLSIYADGGDRVVAKADQRYFHASGFYDINISRDVTSEATWHSSDDGIGGFDSPGVFTARSAGSVEIWAEENGQRSNTLSLEVFEATELAYCDSANINRAVWSDDFNRVVLESDCAHYNPPGVVTLRYTVTETQPHGGVFDPCLDLYVYQGNRRIRTIREEGCGQAFLPTNAPGADEAALKYQLRAFWDLKTDDGATVADGTYTIYGRFYLYYDPVVKLSVQVGNAIPTTPRPTSPTTPTATPVADRAASLTIGSAVGDPGQQVAIDATFRTNGAPVAALQNDLMLASPIRIADSNSGKPLCKVNESIDKSATSFAFLPNGCTPEVDCTGVRAVVLALDNVAPLPDGALVYSCIADIPQSTVAAGYSVDCSNASASDPRGGALPLRCTPGSIRVQGSEMPGPVTVPEIDGNCYIGSMSCSSGSFYPTAQQHCCELWRMGASAAALSWCPAANLDAAGRCTSCAANPCEGIATS